MKQAAEYRKHAEECLRLTRDARTEQERQQLAEMAVAWKRMAAQREWQIARESEQAPDLGPIESDDSVVQLVRFRSRA